MRDRAPMPRGRVRSFRVVTDFPHDRPNSDLILPTRYNDWSQIRRWTKPTNWKNNDTLFEWGSIVGPLLLRQGLNFGIGGLYIEFANVAAPSDTVTPPAITRDVDQGVQYYDSLSGINDYLRVPLVAGTLESGGSDFPLGNICNFFAQTTGLVGVHGNPFSDANNSLVYGAALVAFVNPTDATQDRVLSRWAFAEGEQVVKLSTSQIGLQWQYILE